MGKQLILIVEDDDSIRELLCYALSSEGYAVSSFSNAEDMLCAVEKQMPDLVLLDVMLPGLDGIEALKVLRERYRSVNLRIIMLTAKSSEVNKISGLNAGADDYITKPFSVLELVARVKANLRKFTVETSGETLWFNNIQIKTGSREVFVKEEKIELTFKEFELLCKLVFEANKVVPREKLLSEIWGYDYVGETRTLDIHINTLRKKLKDEGNNILAVRGAGYILKGCAK